VFVREGGGEIYVKNELAGRAEKKFSSEEQQMPRNVVLMVCKERIKIQ
jgi:hypothetical protein